MALEARRWGITFVCMNTKRKADIDRGPKALDTMSCGHYIRLYKFQGGKAVMRDDKRT